MLLIILLLVSVLFIVISTSKYHVKCDWVRLMPRIVEKLEFMTGRVVKVCTKTVTGKSLEHKNLVFRINLQENCLRKGKT